MEWWAGRPSCARRLSRDEQDSESLPGPGVLFCSTRQPDLWPPRRTRQDRKVLPHSVALGTFIIPPRARDTECSPKTSESIVSFSFVFKKLNIRLGDCWNCTNGFPPEEPWGPVANMVPLWGVTRAQRQHLMLLICQHEVGKKHYCCIDCVSFISSVVIGWPEIKL